MFVVKDLLEDDSQRTRWSVDSFCILYSENDIFADEDLHTSAKMNDEERGCDRRWVISSMTKDKVSRLLLNVVFRH